MSRNDVLRITWLGHSCFKVETKDYAVILDPYEDGYVPGLAPLRESANEVLCSHGHGDHGCVDVITVTPKQPSPFTVTAIASYHDDQQGALRGKNTIHVLDNGTLKLAHFGDIGCELTPEQIRALSGLDAALIPVGGFYTIDALQAKALVDQIRPRVVIPMHYHSAQFGFDVLGTLDAFTDLCDTVVEYPDNVLELTKETKPQVAVLNLSGKI